jgi:hypothetical protein
MHDHAEDLLDAAKPGRIAIDYRLQTESLTFLTFAILIQAASKSGSGKNESLHSCSGNLNKLLDRGAQDSRKTRGNTMQPRGSLQGEVYDN